MSVIEARPLGCSFRFLDLDIRVTTNDPAIIDALMNDVPRTQHSTPALETLTYQLVRADDGYLLSGGDIEPRKERSLVIATQTLIASAGRAVRNFYHRAPLISAVTLIHDGRGVLLIGGKGSGRSTLAVALTMAGMSLGGDHLAILDNGLAMPFPGRFLLWSQSLQLLAALPGGAEFDCFKRNATEHTRLALDPVDVGRPWRVEAAPVGAVILLEPNFGGRSRLRQIGATEMSRLALQLCAPPSSPAGFWVGPICAMIGQAETAVLELGTLASAVEVVELFLDRRLARR